jgi:hypothetical protein
VSQQSQQLVASSMCSSAKTSCDVDAHGDDALSQDRDGRV